LGWCKRWSRKQGFLRLRPHDYAKQIVENKMPRYIISFNDGDMQVADDEWDNLN
jgi:hypothetical protein